MIKPLNYSYILCNISNILFTTIKSLIEFPTIPERYTDDSLRPFLWGRLRIKKLYGKIQNCRESFKR